MPRQRWTPEEDERLLNLVAAGKSWTLIGGALRRDMSSVKFRAAWLRRAVRKKRATACRDQAESEEMTVTSLLELEEGAAKLEANARKLPMGPGRDDLLQEVARFRARLSALQATLPPSGEG